MVKHSDTLLPHYIPTPTLCALTGGRLALQFLWKHEHKVAAHVRPCYPLTPHKCSDRFTTRLLGLYYLNPFMLQLRPEESLQCKIFFKKKQQIYFLRIYFSFISFVCFIVASTLSYVWLFIYAKMHTLSFYSTSCYQINS